MLHHLQFLLEGLLILKDCLVADGGMGLMVYAKYGRTGIYHIQEMMKMVNAGVKNRVHEIMNCKAVISTLPATNWYMRGKELFGDYIHYGDNRLYDMFLHKQDRAYSIPELYKFVREADLHFVEFSDALERLRLKVEHYVKDFSLLQKIKQMDIITQQAICELFIGSIIKHSFYVSNKKDTVATVDDLNNVPYFYTITGMPEKLCEIITVNHLEAGQRLDLKLNTAYLKDINISVKFKRDFRCCANVNSSSFSRGRVVVNRMSRRTISHGKYLYT